MKDIHLFLLVLEVGKPIIRGLAFGKGSGSLPRDGKQKGKGAGWREGRVPLYA